MEQKLMEQNPMNPIFGTADCSTCQIEYFSFGKGPDNLLILPGLSIRPVCQSAQFVASQYRCLCNDFTIFVFESRRDMPKGYTIRQMADDTAVAMQTLGIGRACVFGASHGGMIAQELAINYPNLVSGMILASTISAHNDTSTATMKRWSTLADVVGDRPRSQNHRSETSAKRILLNGGQTPFISLTASPAQSPAQFIPCC